MAVSHVVVHKMWLSLSDMSLVFSICLSGRICAVVSPQHINSHHKPESGQGLWLLPCSLVWCCPPAQPASQMFAYHCSVLSVIIGAYNSLIHHIIAAAASQLRHEMLLCLRR